MISTIHVLSGARCFNNRLPNNTVILHGSNSLHDSREYTIEWWITFNEWSFYTNRPLEHNDNDISVTKLTHEIQGNFPTASLSLFSYDDLVEQHIELAGWGLNNQGELSSNMLTATAIIVSHTACEYHIHRVSGERISIREGYFCTAGVPFVSMQYGDFGGPVLHFHKIIGINKGTLPKGLQEFDNHKINIHTSINYYTSFIADVISDNFFWQ
ncbi:PREDICTED: uncharacterized protein LOC105360137 [Ceratosolen solmsi marchali]|uniref:Uncharacterized protein LOC105360137 n=1 Tax=Ceratosolen solmsi marchali TaxID=326594 RepID=A0AAJ6VMD4_9HYME|nr:PREDICTED: uncharacterized protein LOC105360137 [Ceratosolen solmsi marchali]